jgi:hypothetical protein
MDRDVIGKGLGVGSAAKGDGSAAICRKEFHGMSLWGQLRIRMLSFHMEIRRASESCYRTGRVLTILDTCRSAGSVHNCLYSLHQPQAGVVVRRIRYSGSAARGS